MRCVNCSRENQEENIYCNYCGSPLSNHMNIKSMPLTLNSSTEQIQPLIQNEEKKENTGFFSLEKKGINMGILGGSLMLFIAIIWFFGGMSLGWIFFYPPILALIGIYAIGKGIYQGNLTGKNKRQDRK